MITVALGVAQRPYRGETVCGDVITVVEREDYYMLALADGLGHGRHAAAAASAFCDAVRAAANPRDIEGVMNEADRALAATRGAAASLLAIDRNTLELRFAGVGNIEVQAVSAKPVHPVSIPGVLGRRVRKVKVFTFEVSPNDWLAVYSDGISSRYSFSDCLDSLRMALGRATTPQAVADDILDKHGKTTDDVTCAVLHIKNSP